MRWVTLVFVAFISMNSHANTLGIRPVRQGTAVWCWVAVGQMVFEHFGVPNVNPAGDYQCGIVGLLAAGTIRHDCAYRCQNCSVPAGHHSTVQRMISDYPERVAFVTGEQVSRLRSGYSPSALSAERLIAELDDDRPLIAGISPSGAPSGATSQHVALIVGYVEEDELMLLVNDPYPFGSQNPYRWAGGQSNGDGSYWISYESFRRRLGWRESITVRRTGVIDPPRMGDHCCFVGPFGLDACPMNLSGRLPLGSPCTCTYPAARFVGRVCNP